VILIKEKLCLNLPSSRQHAKPPIRTTGFAASSWNGRKPYLIVTIRPSVSNEKCRLFSPGYSRVLPATGKQQLSILAFF
jgi:hypothetical protein